MSSPATVPLAPAAATAHGPRVLFVIPGEGDGNSMIFARRQAESLAAEGIEVELFYLASRTSPTRLLREFRRCRAELKRIRPAIVHAHFGTVTALFTAIAAGSLPLVITYRGSDLNPPPSSYGWRGKARARCGCLFSQVAALRAQAIVCVSRELRSRLWWRRSLATVLPSGVDPEVFLPQPRSSAQRPLGWADHERVALFHAGRDPQGKRLELAQAAVEQARREVPELRLEILDGKVPPALLPMLMNASDCLLLTSAYEGSPTVVQEALACNLPIVSVEVGDVAERLKGVRDSIVSTASAYALGRALASMVEPPRRSNGRSKVAEISSGHIAARLREVYCRLAGG